MKKLVTILIIAIIIVSGAVAFMFIHNGKKKENANGQIINEQANYGNRGNISQVEKVKFLSKNDEYLVGMIGLPVSTENTEFSNDDMIRFALNVAVYRYSDYKNVLTSRANKDASLSYLVQESMVFDIINEYFGLNEVSYDQQTNEYYSKSNKAFLLDENIETTLYYYPVDYSTNSDGISELIADAIFISDDMDKDVIENAKYAGKYEESNVDNTVKFKFNGDGKLVSYQYQ